MHNVSEVFASMVFSDEVMKARLPKETYRQLQQTIRDGRRLNDQVASVVANAMKDWAIEKGAAYFTHWFQPMTGITAEKHDAFISYASEDKVIMEFSGKELIQGEPDASSFPSGGLRATFEARGYTTWDPTSYAFIKDGVLCIPTAFCSYGGEALDKKTPLLRSMETINRQAVRVLHLFGQESCKNVRTTVGPEQEYFLIDKDVFDKRKDLIYTGRTLFGAKPPKGQELDDHYFGVIKPRVQAFMRELNEELWRLGVFAKTEHNEAAPAQHELAPIFTTTNLSTDHNQLTMELMQKIAKSHGMVCLLHEKPFEGVNGSGKHNNWSLCTDSGLNLLEPGSTPEQNGQFLLFLCAVIKAVDDYQELLRISVATAGNDHRLGAHEAPPAVVSIFLGSELTSILEAIENNTPYGAKEQELLKVGVHVLPRFPKDTTDRNRTSPLAFTGNKFEFRMLGASASIADVNTTLNTAVAEVLRQFADELEGAEDFNVALHDLIRKTVRDHKRIIFNGNGYDDAWLREAESRGLSNLPSTPDALEHMLDEKNIELFTKHRVFSETELRARHDILLENYCKILHIEALTMLDMARHDILPCVSTYQGRIAQAINAKRTACMDIDCTYEVDMLRRIAELTNLSYKHTNTLDAAVRFAEQLEDVEDRAQAYRRDVFTAMESLRASVDQLEGIVAADAWPYPHYGEILFSIR